MKTLYLPDTWKKRGAALWNVAKTLEHFHGVCLKVYGGEPDGHFLAYNTIKTPVSKKIKKTLLMGGFKIKDNGIPRLNNWSNFDHVVFNSEFYRKIVLSKYNIKNSSVIHILGGAPSDVEMFNPILERKPLNKDNIKFVVCAKWWKRPFKRLGQTIHLFNNYIQKEYKNSELHILGQKVPKDIRKGNIFYYHKTFHLPTVPTVFRQSDIQIILTPFDSGPLTLTESLHYRIPFISSINCCGPEIISLINGKCGECLKIDREIRSFKDCIRFKPMTRKKFYGRKLNYQLIMETINKIVNNYDEYISWKWTEGFNYKMQSEKWYNLIFGD